MKGKKDIIALDYKIIEINLLKSQHGTHRKISSESSERCLRPLKFEYNKTLMGTSWKS